MTSFVRKKTQNRENGSSSSGRDRTDRTMSVSEDDDDDFTGSVLDRTPPLSEVSSKII